MNGLSAGRILIVDDNETTRFVFARWLRAARFEVTEAATGAEALAALADNDWDLVILDVNLPDMSGYEIAERVKGNPATQAIPVLHVSATAIEPTDKSTGLRRGADAYLIEPLEREELIATVGALLRYSAARREAETLAHRLGWLHEATLRLNGSHDLDHLVSTAATAVGEITAGCAVVAVADVDDGVMASAGPDITAQVVALSANDLVALIASPRDALARKFPGLFGEGPLQVFPSRGRGGELAGALVAQVAADESSTLESVLKQLAQATKVAAENLRLLAREHTIALTLQRSLLPTLPSVAWLDIAVRYAASSSQVEVGGDFYDVLVLDDDRVALIIGDVQGHSLRAAIVMGTLRTSLSAYLLSGRSPAAALDLVNLVLMRGHPDVIATVCCLILDHDGHAVVATAGHFAPVIVADGATWSPPVQGALLGWQAEHRDWTCEIPQGASIVMFTDGLVEQRRQSLDARIAAAETLIGMVGPDVETICERLLADIGPGAAARDDIAILAVRLRPGDH